MMNNDIENETNSILVSPEEKPYNNTTEPIERPVLQVKWRQAWPQLASACIALSTVIQSGVHMAYSAVLLPQLGEKDSNIQIDISQASWIASCMSLALPLASLATGPLVDKYGRKNICILSCIPFLISYAAFFYAKSLSLIIIGRITSGVAGGFTTAALIYASEVSTTELRPVILCLNSLAVATGMLITCVLSLWFNWRNIAGICAGTTIVTIILLLFIPESPQWCAVFKKDSASVLKICEWLYRDPILYNRETKTLLKKVNDSTEMSQDITFRRKFKNLIENYKDPIVYRPFSVLATIFLLQQLTGCYVVIFYAVNIFNSIGGHLGVYADAYVSLVLLGSIRFVIAIVVIVVSRRIGRRQLLMVSSTGMGISTLCIVISMFLQSSTQKEENGNPFILICVLSYVSFSAFGLLVIPWSLIGELLPVKVRGTLGGLSISVAYIFMFIALKLWPISLHEFGALIMFAFLTVICFTMSLYVYIKLPETLGKSFDEIEDCFK